MVCNFCLICIASSIMVSQFLIALGMSICPSSLRSFFICSLDFLYFFIKSSSDIFFMSASMSLILPSFCFLVSLAISFSTSLTLLAKILIMPGFVSMSSRLVSFDKISSMFFCTTCACFCNTFESSSSLYGFNF